MADLATIQRYYTARSAKRSERKCRPVAAKAYELLVGDRPQEQWALRGEEEEERKPAAKKQKPNPPSTLLTFVNAVLAQEKEIGLRVASFLDPHDIPSLFATCKAAHELSKCPTVTQIRLQSIFGFFSVLQPYADQLDLLGYDRDELVRYFTHLAATMQRIYGARYTVHPIHRALVAQELILDEICGCNHYESGDDDEDEDAPRPMFHPKAPRRKLREWFFFTKYHRFSWSVLMGDHYYSFKHSDLIENGHGDGWVDLEKRENVLDRMGMVFLYLYQDEDNSESEGMYRSQHNNDLCISGDDKFKSLAHYFVMGYRAGGFSGDGPLYEWEIQEEDEEEELEDDPCRHIKEDRILSRLHWLYERKLVDIKQQDWKDLLDLSDDKEENDYKTFPLAVVNPIPLKPKQPAREEEEPSKPWGNSYPYSAGPANFGRSAPPPKGWKPWKSESQSSNEDEDQSEDAIGNEQPPEADDNRKQPEPQTDDTSRPTGKPEAINTADRPLTVQEQDDITKATDKMDSCYLRGIIKMIREATGGGDEGSSEDEVDLDFDRLDVPTQRKLQRYVQFLAHKQRERKQSEY